MPGFTAVVWMGYPDPAPMSDVQGRSVTGGSFPAEIWGRFMRAALEGRDVEDFPAPPDELVREPEPAAITVEPDPGAAITVRGTGFGFCQASWSVAVEGTTLTSPPETGSSAEERTATLTLPEDIAPGSYRVVARCDSGAGSRDAAQAALTVRGPTTTSTTPGTTTTSQPGGHHVDHLHDHDDHDSDDLHHRARR